MNAFGRLGSDTKTPGSQTRSRAAWIGLGLIVLATTAVAAEFSYRALVKSRLRALEREVLRRHPAAQLQGTSHARFGKDVLDPVPSLLEDLLAWFPQRGAGYSWLDHPSGELMFVHGYMFFAVHLIEEGEEFSHTFIWSPRRRRFVHYQNWGLRRCDPGSCPWGADPPPAPRRWNEPAR